MSASVIEGVLDSLLTGLGAISVAGGYRNDVKAVSTVLKELADITDFPQVVVVLGIGRLDAIVTDKTQFAEYCRVHVIGYVAASGLTQKDSNNNLLAKAGESMLHDFKKCLGALTITNINDTALRQLIAGKENMFRITRLYADNANKGMVSIDFDILIRYNSPSTF